MYRYYYCAAIAVVITALSQILLKVGANKTRDLVFIRKYLNTYVISGYILFIGVSLLNLYAYQYLPIKMGVVFLPFTFILVALFSYLLLKEKMNRQQFISSLIIIVGVIVYHL